MPETGHDAHRERATTELRAELARLIPDTVFPNSRRDLIEKYFEDFLKEPTVDAQVRCLSETERAMMLDLYIQKNLRDDILEALKRLCLMHMVH